MKAIPGVGAGLTKAGESLSKVPVLNKVGAESITNVLADTTLDTAIDTIPGMIGVYANGGNAGDIALEGVKRTGMNLAMNAGSEAIFRAGSAAIEKVNTVEYQKVPDVQTVSSEIEYKQATIEKFHELREGWVDDNKANEFENTLDKYAQQSVDVGACKSKADFYKMYAERIYTYDEKFCTGIKQMYKDSGASSIVNEKDIENAFSRFETIGRGEYGNFTTSMYEDNMLLYDSSGELVEKNIIESIKGVDPGKYETGTFQYCYNKEFVISADELDLVQMVNGTTPGASSLNIPGGKTWAGENIAYSETELLMPSIDVREYSAEEVFLSIKNKGYFKIENPTVICKDGTKKKIGGCFMIKKIGE